MRSLRTSGDSLSPQLMFEPPNLLSTLTFHMDLPGRRVERRSDRRWRRTRRSCRRRPLASPADRCLGRCRSGGRSPSSQSRFPLAASYAMTYSGSCARAERIQPAARHGKRGVAFAGTGRPPGQRRPAAGHCLQQVLSRPIVPSRFGPRHWGQSSQREVRDHSGNDRTTAAGRTSAATRRNQSVTRLRRPRMLQLHLDARAGYAVFRTSFHDSDRLQLDARHRRFAVQRRLLDGLHDRPSRRRPDRKRCTCRRASCLPVTMKNDVVALAGSSPRAIDRMPLTCFVSLNSGCSGRTSFCCFSVNGPRVVSHPV